MDVPGSGCLISLLFFSWLQRNKLSWSPRWGPFNKGLRFLRMFLPRNPFIRGQIVSPGRRKGKVSTAEFQKPGFPIMTQMPCFFREQRQKGGRSQRASWHGSNYLKLQISWISLFNFETSLCIYLIPIDFSKLEGSPCWIKKLSHQFSQHWKPS